MTHQPVDLADQIRGISEFWSPRVIAAVNDYDVKVARIQGEFVWHSHEDTDEAFLVIDGTLTIELRDGSVTLAPGQMYVVPKGVEHRPVAESECQILLFEPRGTINTGDCEDSPFRSTTGERSC